MLDGDLECEGRGVQAMEANAGDVALFVSDVWHRRLPTSAGDAGRFLLQAHYGRRDIAQRVRPSAESNQVSEAAAARTASDRERRLLGLHPPLFYDGRLGASSPAPLRQTPSVCSGRPVRRARTFVMSALASSPMQ